MGNYTKTTLNEIAIIFDKAPIYATLYTADATATLHIPYLLLEQAALSRLNSH